MGAGGRGSQRVVEDGVFRGEGLGIEPVTKGQQFSQSHLCDAAATKARSEGVRSASGWVSTCRAGDRAWRGSPFSKPCSPRLSIRPFLIKAAKLASQLFS